MPSLLVYRVEQVEERLRALEEALELTPAQLRAMVTTVPQVLAQQLQHNIKPSVDYFTGTLGLSRDEIQQTCMCTARCARTAMGRTDCLLRAPL